MNNLYEYKFSAVEPRDDFRQILVDDLVRAKLNPIVFGDTVMVNGDDTFENSMMYMSRFLHFNNHEFSLKLKRG